ncbi:unnamed protein product [Effrenium voratum]|uniref:Uncharacterized protein n=1 Tax=Effrenium voratum TaxID=2562239 RepID=A0AA36HXG8_9DINO|nr:unnamed protein product [Effrenium voratum]
MPPPEDFPPPMPESAPMSSSPFDLPVPVVEEARSAPLSAPVSGPRGSAPMSSAMPGTATPTDGVAVPTDMPSPTSPARGLGKEEMRGPAALHAQVLPEPDVPREEEEIGSAPMALSASALPGASSSAVHSPSEPPVPTDRPSPTSPAAGASPMGPATIGVSVPLFKTSS